MLSNDWERRLAAEVNHTGERTAAASATGNRNEKIRLQLCRQFLDEFRPLLKASIDKFNQSSQAKIELVEKGTDKRGNLCCTIKFRLRQINFVDTERGFIRVDLVEPSSESEAAFLLARLSRSGDLITWDEKSLLGFGNRLEPVTKEHLVRKYITLLVTG